MEGEAPAKSHRVRHSGRKAEKRQQKDNEAETKQRNPKAFAIQSANKLNRAFRRAQDVKSRKHHIPVVDRTPLEPPPVVVAIVGPPKVGKTTLLNGILKHYTRQKISNIQGPVTLVTGKHRRLTLIECNNDLTSMIDVAKIADLILLMVDASFGFEMETFEFLNICQVHGFPKVMGILTHLDSFKQPKTLKKTKKNLKHRFWTELYQGAKLFYLTGMVYGEYPRTEIRNLCRFISVMKFRPLTWRSSHSYVLADRMEDITDPEKLRVEPHCNRNISVYGYVRGTHLKPSTMVHIPGAGDYQLHNVSFLHDPCPLPDRGDKKQRRTLDVRERVMYAPMSGVGGIVYDKDAVYIDVDGNEAEEPRQNLPESIMMSSMIDTTTTMDSKMTESKVALFTGEEPLSMEQAERMMEVRMPDEELVEDAGRRRRRAIFQEEEEQGREDSGIDGSSDDDSDDESSQDEYEHEDSGGEDVKPSDEEDDGPSDKDEPSALKWKVDIRAKAEKAFMQRQSSSTNLQRLVYGVVEEEEEEKSGNEQEQLRGGLFKVTSNDQPTDIKRSRDQRESSRELSRMIRDWMDVHESRELIADCFITGSWGAGEDAGTLLEQDNEIYGDFEDLETGLVATGDDAKPTNQHADMEVHEAKETKKDREARMREKRMERKRKLKEAFDRDYDVDKVEQKDERTLFDDVKRELSEQTRMNREEFENMDDATRVLYEGFRPGLYIRVELRNVPTELVEHFDPTYPLILGGVTSTEGNMGYLRTRVKRHRWYKKILKTRDPVIVSVGWRRYQTLPMYYMEDHNLRQRMLKYTPQYMHCWGLMYGPITPQGAGFLAVQSISGSTPQFRIAATGTILESDCSTNLVKKLKLVGYPYKIYKNTCFVKGMFNSPLEVAKFEGASIKSVSGIRGHIKKAVTGGSKEQGPPGSFRGMFEDKLLMSDIVFCRTWYPVQVPKMYVVVSNLLIQKKDSWNAMKSVGQLRFEQNVKVPVKGDSLYKPIVRPEGRQFHGLVVPRSLQRELPFKSKPKNERGKKEGKRDKLMKKAVVREPKDKQIAALMVALRTMDNSKKRTKKEERKKQMTHHKMMLERQEIKDHWRHKEAKKKIYKALAKSEKRKSKSSTE